jgi:C-terminal of Roc, COR, domain
VSGCGGDDRGAPLTAAAEERWMPEPRKLFPRKWVAIKEWLESLDKEGKNYLDYEAFARECAARGEPDPQKQAEVAALMHDLGVAMNYARDERLRDTTVLRPDWLANGQTSLKTGFRATGNRSSNSVYI